MCGRFFVDGDDRYSELTKIMNQAGRQKGSLSFQAETGEIAPTATVAVLANNRKRVPTPFVMRWGIRRSDGKGVIINARSETAAEKPAFRRLFLERRCLIPASWFFEWKECDEGKLRFAIKPANARIIYMAGLYRVTEDGELPEFVILTMEASQSVTPIHPRMPVVLPKSSHGDWLSLDADPVEVLAQAETEMICSFSDE